MKSALLSIPVLLISAVAALACAPDRVEIRGDFGTARFTVELADEPDERSRGLMNRPSLPMSQGMLFLYEAPSRATFWMRNTLIPLDMIFTDVTGTITHIHENAIPLDETLIDGGREVFAVLEINGGLSGAMGISVGDVLRHPGFSEGPPAWPCE